MEAYYLKKVGSNLISKITGCWCRPPQCATLGGAQGEWGNAGGQGNTDDVGRR